MAVNNAAITPHYGHRLFENIGVIDRSIRVLLAIACIGQVLLFDREIVTWQDYAVMLGFYFTMTAMMRWDPIYALFYESSKKRVVSSQ